MSCWWGHHPRSLKRSSTQVSSASPATGVRIPLLVRASFYESGGCRTCPALPQ